MIFIQCVAMAMAELCSSMPTSVCLSDHAAYHRVDSIMLQQSLPHLAGDHLRPGSLAGRTGWFRSPVRHQSIMVVSIRLHLTTALSAMILATASLNYPDYNVENYQIFLLTSLIMIMHGMISSMPTLWIARFNSVGTTMNILILVVVVILIPAATTNVPKFTDSATVWGTIENGTDWPDGVAVLMSFLSVIWTMSGYDAPFHLSEECSNASIASPRAIVMTSGVGGIMGWALQLVIAYTVTDIPAVLSASQPWAGYCFQVLSAAAANAVIALTIACAFMMGQGCMVAASRVTFAYARDGCFPLSRFWSRVNPITRTPVNAVWFNVFIGELLLLLIFAGEVAIGALFSVGAIAAFVAFTIPIAIRVFVVGNRFRPGPWNLGKFSRPIGIAAVSFVLVMLPILCFPAYISHLIK
jgi:amino acid transporter